MLTPEGQSGEKTDKIMLLAMWASKLQEEAGIAAKPFIVAKPFIAAGMGKPTYPIHPQTVATHLNYWKEINTLLMEAENASEPNKAKAALGYGNPQGDSKPRQIMAQAMTRWYNTAISPDNILFTVGGAGALRIIFETFNALYPDMPKYRVITPFPHYTLYSDNRHQLHPVEVMKEPGYQLTAKALEASIASANLLAKKDNNYPKVVLLCNPGNPLGTVISESEWIKIADVLRQHPDLNLVIDEAYAEMVWQDEKIPALIKIAPDLKERIIIIRSATKALSAAGERMAMLMAFSTDLMSKLLDKNIATIGHPPRSAQLAYAETMAEFGESEQAQLKDYYKPKLDYVSQRLQAMGACMPSPQYQVESTFYTMADFSDLLGVALPDEAKRALGKSGRVQTSEDLTYYLLFKESLMIAPGSYFGLPKNNGFMRITCSGTNDELKELMDRLEGTLLQARQAKSLDLLRVVTLLMTRLSGVDSETYKLLSEKIIQIQNNDGTCLALKKQNHELKEMLSTINVLIKKSTDEGRMSAARTIQSFFKRVKANKENARFTQAMEKEWRKFVEKMVPVEGAMKNYFLNLGETDKSNFMPWVEHLKTIALSSGGMPDSNPEIRW